MTSPVARSRLRWAVPAVLVLLSCTAVLYLWGLNRSGWANAFYAAAVQAGTHDPTALLFGSLDPANAITVDKPPAALWVMGLSARIFGFNPWSLLAPQALEGVASVGLLYAAVARTSGRVAGMAAGAILALTPVATVMFRFDDPDALMMLLIVAGAYCTVRACGSHSAPPTRSAVWMTLAGVAIGFGFLTKMSQALIVVPALAATYLTAAPGPVRRRLLGVCAAAAASAVSAGWYIGLVALWPAPSRPYIGGSTDDSLTQLAIGYNGVGRLAGGDGNPQSGGWGAGPLRLFGQSMGTGISWLLPAAVIGLLVLIVVALRAPRTAPARAAAVLWGGWLLTAGGIISAMQGIVHSYYAAMLAPAIAALVAAGAAELWHRRDTVTARLTAAAMTAVTGAWGFVLLGRTPLWLPWLRWAVVVGCSSAALGLAASGLLPAVSAAARGRRHGAPRSATRTAAMASAAACTAALLAPGAYSVASAAQPHSGASPKAGPNGSVDLYREADRTGGGVRAPGLVDAVRAADSRWAAAAVGATTAARLELETDRPVMAVGGYSAQDPAPTLAEFQADVADGLVRYFLPRPDLDRFSSLILEGLGDGSGRSSAVTPESSAGVLAQLLAPDVETAGATVDSARRTGRPFLVDGAPPKHRGTTEAHRITAWVQTHFSSSVLGGLTVYDLTQPHRAMPLRTR